MLLSTDWCDESVVKSLLRGSQLLDLRFCFGLFWYLFDSRCGYWLGNLSGSENVCRLDSVEPSQLA